MLLWLGEAGFVLAGDRFAPPAFDIAKYAPEGLYGVNIIPGLLSEEWLQDGNEAFSATAEPVRSNLTNRVVALRGGDWTRAGLGEYVLGAEAREVLFDPSPAGLEVLISWLPGFSRLTGPGLHPSEIESPDRWKLKVKASPVPTLILRASW